MDNKEINKQEETEGTRIDRAIQKILLNFTFNKIFHIKPKELSSWQNHLQTSP